MGLEVATYVGGLTPSWPLSGDTKSQGDDHIRLIKATLQATFPVTVKPFYFPTTEAASANMVLDATDNNNELLLDTTSGGLTVTLPAGLTTTDKGFKATVVKTSTDANAILISAAANIASKVGSTATIRVGIPYEPAYFTWNGSAWYCTKPGAVIGATYSLDGPLLPGFLELDGTTYSNTAYAELFAYLASTTLSDHAGRTEFGRDAAQSRITTAVFGGDVTAAKTGSTTTQTRTLVTANLPPYTPAGTQGAITFPTSDTATVAFGGAINAIGLGTKNGTTNLTSILNLSQAAWVGTPQGGTSQALSILPPSIIKRKAIRAC